MQLQHPDDPNQSWPLQNTDLGQAMSTLFREIKEEERNKKRIIMNNEIEIPQSVMEYITKQVDIYCFPEARAGIEIGMKDMYRYLKSHTVEGEGWNEVSGIVQPEKGWSVLWKDGNGLFFAENRFSQMPPNLKLPGLSFIHWKRIVGSGENKNFPQKCDKCKHQHFYKLGADEIGGGNTDARCIKGHWNGMGQGHMPSFDFWANCEDFEPKPDEVVEGETIECNSEVGVTVGLIDSLMSVAAVLVAMDWDTKAVQEAIKDIRNNDNLKRIMDMGELSSAKEYIQEQRHSIKILADGQKAVIDFKDREIAQLKEERDEYRKALEKTRICPSLSHADEIVVKALAKYPKPITPVP